MPSSFHAFHLGTDTPIGVLPAQLLQLVARGFLSAAFVLENFQAVNSTANYGV